LEESVTGTPQGGIISPTLANFTLNGLEPTIMKAVKEQYSVGSRGIYVGQVVNSDGRKVVKHLTPQVTCVRFADDFIVMARSERMITSVIKPCVEQFLAERGLTLSVEKTKILSVRKSDKINFLGYTFQYQERFSPKYKRFRDRAGREGIACYPQKERVSKFQSKLKAIFKTSYNLTAYSLIAKLNPIIRGWAAYFNLSQSYDIRNRVNYALYRYIWDWAAHKHPRWGRRDIARQYFLKPTLRDPGGSSLGYNSSELGRIKKWTFRGQTLNNSIFNQFTGGKTIELIDPTTVVGTLSAKQYRIPSALETVHAYHPDYRKLIEFNQKMSLEVLKEIKTLKSKLLIRQKGVCGICKEPLLKLENEFTFDGSMHIHHIKSRADGGSKNSRRGGNLMLVHAQCHMTPPPAAKKRGAEQGRK
jgi:RNA-directed DNA polymerase